MVGLGIPAPMVACLDGDGLDGRSHAARQFTAELAREADLIICMTARHRAWCAGQAPFASDRTFLLAELAAAAEHGAPLVGGPSGIAQAVRDFQVELAGTVLDDVPDPYGGPQREYDNSYAIIRSAVDLIADWAS
jgi:protein-tyrosine-phosphatase